MEAPMNEPIFDPGRVYDDEDAALDLIANKSKRAQWRHRRVGPCYLKFGRRVKYKGSDLNSWAESNRIETDIGMS